MEAHDVTSEVDLGPDENSDPFAGVEADPLADPLVEAGVQQGSLQGDNPSELEPVAEEDPGPEEEPEPPSLVPDEERPADVPDEDEAPVAEADEPEHEAPEDPETPVAETPPGEESAVEPEEPKAEKPKRKTRKSSKKKDPDAEPAPAKRGYVILRAGAEPGIWQEAFERPNADSEEPFVLEHRNGTTALRAAYRMLSDAEKEPQDYVLVCVPRKLWNVKKVAGRVHKQTAISVG